MLHLYWDIGQMIDASQREEGWGAAVIPRLAADIQNDLPDIRGFSARNLDRMVAFYRAYPPPAEISPQAVAQVTGPPAAAPDPGLLTLPWGHHAVILNKVRDPGPTSRGASPIRPPAAGRRAPKPGLPRSAA